MPRTTLSLTGAALPEPIDFERPGMPALDTVHTTIQHTDAAGDTYHILRTTEFDAYDTDPEKAAIAQLLKPNRQVAATDIAQALRAAPPPDDNFAGTARKAAKLSIGTAPMEQFADVHALIAALPHDEQMIHHRPPIAKGASSARVSEEQRNAHLVTAYLYAASHEKDNDFHLIVGCDPNAPPETYMTAEVSGLPPADSPAFQKLKAARDAFKAYFGPHLPVASYDFYHPPIPILVEGSVFFDIEHAVGGHPGPPSLKSRMPTIWEIHPVTSIQLGRRR